MQQDVESFGKIKKLHQARVGGKQSSKDLGTHGKSFTNKMEDNCAEV